MWKLTRQQLRYHRTSLSVAVVIAAAIPSVLAVAIKRPDAALQLAAVTSGSIGFVLSNVVLGSDRRQGRTQLLAILPLTRLEVGLCRLVLPAVLQLAMALSTLPAVALAATYLGELPPRVAALTFMVAQALPLAITYGNLLDEEFSVLLSRVPRVLRQGLSALVLVGWALAVLGIWEGLHKVLLDQVAWQLARASMLAGATAVVAAIVALALFVRRPSFLPASDAPGS